MNHGVGIVWGLLHFQEHCAGWEGWDCAYLARMASGLDPALVNSASIAILYLQKE